MIYEEYYKKYYDYRKNNKEKNDLENKKVQLIGLVDVKSSSTKNGNYSNQKEDKFLFYTAELEETELKIYQKDKILEELKTQLKTKENELRESKDVLDKVYLYKYIDKLKYYQISKKIKYSKSRTYDFINEVDKNIEKIKKMKSSEKIGKN